MKEIDLNTWGRRAHYKKFRDFEQPLFGMCANVDTRRMYEHSKQLQVSFTVAIVFVLSKVANSIPQFRHRIRGAAVVEHDRVHPSTTVLLANDLFSFCTMEYREPFRDFARGAEASLSQVSQDPTLEDEPGRDDYLFMTSIPWVTFTSFQHPSPSRVGDSIPRFAWGKRQEVSGRLEMPLAVQGHHALMDGIHLGEFYGQVSEALQCPEDTLGA